MDETYNDLYPLQLKDPEVPIQEDCSSDIVPAGTTDMEGKKKVLVPELITMTKVLFDRYRLTMYSYLNRCLRNGTLASMVGSRITTRIINHDICSFPGVTYWRIDRENFYADVTVELRLQAVFGMQTWKGVLVFWCGFDENGLYCSIEDLTEETNRAEDGLDMLSPYLVPYATNKRVDEISESIWGHYLPEALTDPTKRISGDLVKRMGLTIEFHPIYEHRNVESIIFFKQDELSIGEDRKEKDAHGKEHHIKAKFGKPVIIPANTIVININKICQDYSSFNVFHECYHYEEHYLFFCLQEMGSNDVRQVKTREVIVDKDEVVKDPIYFIEKQANRGGYGLMMPATDTGEQISEQCREAEGYFTDMIKANPNMELVGIYGDKGRSGLKKAGRPGLQRLLDDCRAGKINLILTKSISRFARNMAECAEMIRELNSLGVNVLFEEQNLNSRDERSALILNIFAAIAEEESRSISRHTLMAHEQYALEGRPLGRISFGYKDGGDHKWVINEEEAPLVRKAFEMADEGKTYAEIRKALNEMGDITWSHSRLKYLLTNVVYKGDYHSHKSICIVPGKQVENKGFRDRIYIEEHHEPIVSHELFDRVQDRVSGNRRSA